MAKRWHAATKQFLDDGHAMIVAQDRATRVAKDAKTKAGRRYIVDMLIATREMQDQRARDIAAWELKHDREWQGAR